LISIVILVIACEDNPIDAEAPNPPSNLAIDSVFHNSVYLRWTHETPDETSYRISRSEEDRWSHVHETDIDVYNWTDTNLTEFTSYQYRVYASRQGAVSSGYAEASVTTKLTPPGNFTAAAIANSRRIQLSWQDNSEKEKGYVIVRSAHLDNQFSTVDSLEADAVTYSDNETIEYDKTYYYRLYAFNGENRSTCAEAEATTPHGPPAAPSHLAAEPVSANEGILRWQDNSHNEDGFEIERKTGIDGQWILSGQTAENSTSWMDSEVIPLTIYYYKVRAYNDAGYSDYSTEIMVRFASVSINNGDEFTPSRNVYVHLNAPGNNFVALSNDSISVVDDPQWTNIPNRIEWELEAGEGTKTVFVCFMDNSDRKTAIYRDSIEPLLGTALQLTIAEDADTVQSNVVDVTFDALDADSMQICLQDDFTEVVWVPYEQYFRWDLGNECFIQARPSQNSKRPIPHRDAEDYKLYARVKNSFDVPSNVVSGDITVEIFGSVNINEGAEFAPSRRVQVHMNAPAADVVALSNDSLMLLNEPVWRGYVDVVFWTLEPGSGIRTVFVQFKNRSQAESRIMSAGILPMPINPSIEIEGGSEFTPGREVIVSFTTDGEIDSIQISMYEDFREAEWIEYSDEMTVELLTGEGEKYVYAMFMNDFEIVSEPVSASITPMPINPQIEIERGSEFTPDRDVNVSLSADGEIDSVQVSVNEDFRDTEWIEYTDEITVELLTGEGDKIVYAKFINDFEIVSEVVTAVISPLPMDPSIEINNGSEFTSFREVVVSLAASGVIDSVQISAFEDFHDVGWIGYTDETPVTLPPGESIKTVYAVFMNDFEITSDVVNDIITPQPMNPNIILNDGAEITNSLTLDLAMPDVAALEMKLSDRADFLGTVWVEYETNIDFEINEGDGERRVYAKFRHELFETEPVDDAISVDTQVEIEDFTWSSEGGDVLFPEDIVSLELRVRDDVIGAETDGAATVSIEEVNENIQLQDVGAGRYTGEYQIQDGSFVIDGEVAVTFTDRAGNIIQQSSDDLINIRAQQNDWQYLRTDNSHIILIQSAAIDGAELEIEDEIGVFTTVGLCAGIVVINEDEFPTGITVWGDDPTTDEIDGFIVDELISFRFWDMDQHIERQTGTFNVIRGELRYKIDGITVLSLRASLDEDHQPYNWWFVRTDVSHNVLIRTALINDEALTESDEIGVFTPNVTCAGIVVISEDGFPTGITAWGDDVTTDYIDGFRVEEEMTFRIWDADQNLELDAEAFNIEAGNLSFANDGITVLSLRGRVD